MAIRAGSILPTKRGPSAFWYPDKEGAYNRRGRRMHAALDWFAEARTDVRSPVDGVVVQAKRSSDSRGQVYGGTLKIQDRAGRVWVMRHAQPRTTMRYGSRVVKGEHVADVSPWRDAPNATHVHLEVWKTLAGGYWVQNMVDPGTISWEPWRMPWTWRRLRANNSHIEIRINGRRRVYGWSEDAWNMVQSIAVGGLKTNWCVIAFRGPGRTSTGVWRGRRDVINVCRNIKNKYMR